MAKHNKTVAVANNRNPLVGAARTRKAGAMVGKGQRRGKERLRKEIAGMY